MMTEREFLEKAERITSQIRQRVVEDEKTKLVVSENPNSKEIITYQEAEQQYFIEHYRDTDDLILVIHGDVYVIGDVNDDWFGQQLENMNWNGNLYGILITGSLFVDGDVIDDGYLQLHVSKNLTCNYLFSYNGQQEVRGDANVKYGIYGEYNDGFLRVLGKIYSPYIISRDHDMPRVAEGDYIYIEGGNGTEKEYIAIGKNTGGGIGWNWYYYENSGDLFLPEVWNDEDKFVAEHFFNIVRKGKNPFITSAK